MADDPVSEADCQEKTRMQWDPTKRALKEKYGDGIDPKKRLGLYTDARLTAIHYRLPQANYRDTVETRDVDIMAIQQEQLEATSEITASDVQTMFEDMSISAPKRKKAAKNPFLANLQKTQRDEFLAWLEIGDNWKSSKMVKLVQILAKILKVQNFAYDDECRGSAIVFADFLCALDVARVALRKSEGTKHLAVYEYSGDMAPKVRQQQLDDFRAHGIDNPAVLLMTAPCGSEGLEVTNATWVVFLNPCWNPHVELQCVSRAHRIGQLGRVSIVHIVARDSIEDRVVEKQDAKTDKAKELLELYTLEEYNGWTTRLSFEFVRSQVTIYTRHWPIQNLC
jgi:SNF2 family DNA or RNA helicase